MSGNASAQAGGASRTVALSRRFAYSAERVYDAWLDPAGAGRWLFCAPNGEMQRVEIDARVGGSYVFTDRRAGTDIEHVGEYLELDRPRRIVFTFSVPHFSQEQTLVAVDIVPTDDGCELILTHSGVLPEWAEQTTHGWDMILDGLEQNLDRQTTGVGKVVEIQRSFAAPRELVWAAFTQPEQLAQWWGPAGWDNPVCEVDLRPGGRLFIEMRGPEPWGSHPMGGTIHEVDPPQRLVFTSRAFGNDAEGWQLEARNTITLAEQDGGTLLRLHAEVTHATPAMAGALSGMELGWGQSLDKLAALLGEGSAPCGDLAITLPDDTSIRIQRTFAAPPELLWAATTEREHLLRWWGGCGEVKLVESSVDLRVGGSYRHVLRDPAGNEFGFGGKYLELEPGRRVVQTFVFDPHPEAEAVETAEYEAVPGGTRLTVTIRHKSREARDGHYFSGMEHGMKASYNALDALLEKLLGGQG